MLLSSLLYFRGKERGEENKRKRNGNERAIGSRVIQVSQTHRAFLFRFHLALIGGGIFSRSSSHLVDGNIITSASPAGLHLSTTLSSMFDLWRCMDQLCRVGKRHCTALKSVKIRSSSYISSTIQEHQILQLFFLKRMITYMLHNPIKYPSVYQILKSKSVSSTGGPQVHHKDLTSVEGNLCGMTRPPCNGPASMCVYIGPSRRLDYEECIPYCVIFWHCMSSVVVPSLRLHLSVIDDDVTLEEHVILNCCDSPLPSRLCPAFLPTKGRHSFLHFKRTATAAAVGALIFLVSCSTCPLGPIGLDFKPAFVWPSRSQESKALIHVKAEFCALPYKRR
ncbi:hypothetical protein C4D60_Mb06t10100 [Musa balbisiana]|uniref:Uncharacterized protein n=1 Tax=Musa balbisiana TaxID=52838 RepID=A0A4S8IMP6_MUSBA|nr:hypothetical protein C4D60_Mb06t10100 [Musa balbisiana]